jgi:hypothetical protein
MIVACVAVAAVAMIVAMLSAMPVRMMRVTMVMMMFVVRMRHCGVRMGSGSASRESAPSSKAGRPGSKQMRQREHSDFTRLLWRRAGRLDITHE